MVISGDDMNYRRLYRQLYKLFDNMTPLNDDCGKICGANCCKGDGNTGMLLFPHESTTLKVIESDGMRIAVCNGKCERSERPLSCRIFPLFPICDERGKIKAVPDYRGFSVCPMIEHSDKITFSPRFLRRVKKAGRLLYRDKECADFMKKCSDEITDAEALIKP